jgi:hypothetical protein
MDVLSALKDQGNDALKRGDMAGAVGFYTRAIGAYEGGSAFVDAKAVAVVFSNRAQAHLTLGDGAAALSDAKQAVCFDPSYPKAHHRRWKALELLGGREAEALEAKRISKLIGSKGMTFKQARDAAYKMARKDAAKAATAAAANAATANTATSTAAAATAANAPSPVPKKTDTKRKLAGGGGKSIFKAAMEAERAEAAGGSAAGSGSAAPAAAPDAFAPFPRGSKVAEAPHAGGGGAAGGGGGGGGGGAARLFKVLEDDGATVTCFDADAAQPERLRRPKAGLVLEGNAQNGWPSGYELVSTSPCIGSIDVCDRLVHELERRTAEPQLAQQAPMTFAQAVAIFAGQQAPPGAAASAAASAAAAAAAASGVACLVHGWVEGAGARAMSFALDAVAHHFFVEWRAAEGGRWRLLQSYMGRRRRRGGSAGTADTGAAAVAAAAAASAGGAGSAGCAVGYSAREWVDPCGACGSVSHEAHALYGGGRLLSDAQLAEFLGKVQRLRELAEALLYEQLAPQLPRSLGYFAPPRAGATNEELGAWAAVVQPVSRWAARRNARALEEGATMYRGGDTVQVEMGTAERPGERLFDLPASDVAALDAAYAAVTGEAFTALHCLRLLEFMGGDRFTREAEEGATGGGVFMGWTLRMIMFNQDF